jgi:flagellar biosynthesis chaperone FliJ
MERVAIAVMRSHAQHEEILNLRKLLENQTKILKKNEDRLVSRETVLEQAYVGIEQLQVQFSTLMEEKLSIENELFSTNSKYHELEQQHTAAILCVNEL